MWYSYSLAIGGGIIAPSRIQTNRMKSETPKEEVVPPEEIPIPQARAETIEGKLQKYRTEGKFALPPGSGEPIPNALNNKAINPGAGRMDQHQGFGGDDCKGNNWRHYVPEDPLSYYSA